MQQKIVKVQTLNGKLKTISSMRNYGITNLTLGDPIHSSILTRILLNLIIKYIIGNKEHYNQVIVQYLGFILPKQNHE